MSIRSIQIDLLKFHVSDAHICERYIENIKLYFNRSKLKLQDTKKYDLKDANWVCQEKNIYRTMLKRFCTKTKKNVGLKLLNFFRHRKISMICVENSRSGLDEYILTSGNNLTIYHALGFCVVIVHASCCPQIRAMPCLSHA